MTAQDDLHELIEEAVEDVCYNAEGYGPSSLAYGVAADAAKAVLAAGYRRPRTITTAEELDGLASGTVIRDYTGVTWHRYAKVYDKPVWFAATRDTGFYFDSNIIDDGRLPATVLYEPTA